MSMKFLLSGDWSNFNYTNYMEYTGDCLIGCYFLGSLKFMTFVTDIDV